MIRHFVLASVSVVALTAAANAADMYGPAGGYKDGFVPVPAWTGFYAGVNGGYGWSADDATLNGAAQLCTVATGKTVCASGSGTITNGSGASRFVSDDEFAGGQIGFNWQPAGGNFVFGVEADIQGSTIQGSQALNAIPPFTTTPAPNGLFNGSSQLDWFGTVRGRIGYAWCRSLIYATGGVAFGGVKDSLTAAAATGNPVAVDSNTTATGYVVGGGIEHYINPAWSIKAEYQYIDLGSDKLSATALTPGTYNTYATASLDVEHDYHTVRVGLNYHILPDYVPLK